MSQYKIIAEPDGTLSANKDMVTYRLEGAEGKEVRWKVNNGKRAQAVYRIAEEVEGPEGKRYWTTRWHYPGQHQVIAEVKTDDGILIDTWEVVATHNQRIRADMSWLDTYQIVSDPPIKTITPGAKMTYRVERTVKGKQLGFPMVDKVKVYWSALNYSDDQEKELEVKTASAVKPTIQATAEKPGHHRLMAQIKFEGQRRLVLDYPQEVISLDQCLKAGPSLPARKEDGKDPEVILRSADNYYQVMEKLEAKQPAPANKKEEYDKQKEQRKEFIDKLTERLVSTKGKPRYKLVAHYWQADKSKYINLNVFASPMNDAGTEWKIVDWTVPQQRHTTGEYTGSGRTPKEALRHAIQEWNDGNRYPPKGGINYEFEHPNYDFKIKSYFTTDGKSDTDTWASILEWAALGAAVVGGVLTAIAPVPGSRIASAAIWSFVFSAGVGATAGVINLGSRHSEGFNNAKDDAFDALTIVGSMLGAGVAIRWARGASVVMHTGSKITKYALIGMIGTDVSQGVLIGIDQYKEFDAISTDPKLTPEERLNKILALVSKTVLTGGLIVYGVKGTKTDLNNLSQKSQFVDPDMAPKDQLKKLADPNETIIIKDKGTDGKTTASTSGQKHETIIQTNQSNKAVTATQNNDKIAQRVQQNRQLEKSPQFDNDLNKVGVTKAQISAMRAKEVPLGFKDKAQFDQFKSELDEILKKSELKDAEIGLKGTSTTFYSENPSKRLGHHWDADPKNLGDYDLNITSNSMVETMNKADISPHPKYNVYKTKDINKTFPELDAFQKKWSATLDREVNFVGYPKTTSRDATEYLLRSPE